jgi:hypothetical protein
MNCVNAVALEDAMTVILRRLGADPADLRQWRGRTLSPGDPSLVIAAMNGVLGKLKPPPRR